MYLKDKKLRWWQTDCKHRLRYDRFGVVSAFAAGATTQLSTDAEGLQKPIFSQTHRAVRYMRRSRYNGWLYKLWLIPENSPPGSGKTVDQIAGSCFCHELKVMYPTFYSKITGVAWDLFVMMFFVYLCEAFYQTFLINQSKLTSCKRFPALLSDKRCWCAECELDEYGCWQIDLRRNYLRYM